MTDAKTVLEVRGLKKSFQHICALDDLSLRAGEGKITIIVGDNGSGKTTLIRILSGNMQPDAGEIIMNGKPVRQLTPEKAISSGIRTVYQDLALDNCKNSIENIFLGRELCRGPFLDKKRMREEAIRLLHGINIEIPDLEEPVRHLSGGQRQGVAIARALYQPGQVLLLDEPTSAMGVQECARTLELLSRLRDEGRTQLWVCHNMRQVFDIADYIYVLRMGRCIAHMAAKDSSIRQLENLLIGR